MDDKLIEIGQFLFDVAVEAMRYSNISKPEISFFESAVWKILMDPNSSKDNFICEDNYIWYFHLTDGQSAELTAKNLSLCIQDEKSITDFAALVFQGR